MGETMPGTRLDTGTALSRPDPATGGTGGINSGTFITETRRSAGFPLDLPAYENDVLNALTRSGGLPGAEAEDEVGVDHVVIADLCLDEYTDHGHCGVLAEDGSVDNDATLERYRRIAVAQAEAGAHMVGPSGMMDGQVAAIRDALDATGHDAVGIMAYAAKFASALYGPFRDAAECAPKFGDRAGYQMDPANGDEAIREIVTDIAEGADIVMVKPAVPYLDVIRRAKDATAFPMAAYHVSGEYAMVKAAVQNGWLDERRTVLEILTSIRRAGADLILTYHAKDAADWITHG
jgi:porphobilinogen synthase